MVERPHERPLIEATPQTASKLPETNIDANDDVMRIVPIGGCEEVGRNMEGIFYKDEIVVIDCGVQFADQSTPGVDYILPNTRILEERKERVKGILITHGHLDHIGALPYILPKLGFPPVLGTKLTLGFAKAQLEEFEMVNKVEWRVINPDEPAIKLGKHFTVDFFRVNHSIPDATGVCVQTPTGNFVHTGDFKFDFTPPDGLPADMAKMTMIGTRGVDLLMSDSTNALKPGHTVSESVIIKNLTSEIRKAKGRIILATFASLIGRIQHVITAAHVEKRKIFVSGRSMVRNIKMAVDLGYLTVPQGILRELNRSRKELKETPDDKVLLICTGSQGEELAALSRIGSGEHPDIKVKKSDTIIFSSTPIPGNELAVAGVWDNLVRRGGTVITNRDLDIHASGHGQQEDLKLMIQLMRPRNIAPVHGMHFMRFAHGQLAIGVGVGEKNVFLTDNGDVLEIHPNHTVTKAAYAQDAASIYIDGLGIGDVTKTVIDDRVRLSENGMVTIILRANTDGTLAREPEIITRGFTDIAAGEKIIAIVKSVATDAFEKTALKGEENIKLEIIREVEIALTREIDREPIIIPIVIAV